jgi:hypothetical protein
MITPDSHQERDAHQLLAALKNYNAAIDQSEPGTGKSLTFLYLCKLCGARPAIITRKAVIPAWVTLCERMGLNPLFIANYEQLLSDDFPFTETKMVIPKTKVGAPPAKPKKQFVKWNIPDKRVIFGYDEAQALRSASTFSSKAALAAAKEFKVVLLSATPFQTPLEALVIGRILKLFPNGKEFSWMLSHGVRKNLYGQMQFVGDKTNKRDPHLVKEYQAEGREIMAKIGRDIVPSRGVRTRRSEIPGFPESVIEVMSVETDNSSAITKLYLKELDALKERDHERAAEGVDPEFAHMVEVLPVVVNLRIRQQIEILKAKAMVDLALIAMESGEQTAIFCNFDATISILKDMLDTDMVIRGSGELRGDLARHNVVRMFQKNQRNICIINSAAGGAGLSLHDDVTQVSRTTIVSPPYSAILLHQIQGRVWRRGGGYSSQKIVFAAGTLEDKIMAVVKTRGGNLESLLDSDLDIRNYSQP